MMKFSFQSFQNHLIHALCPTRCACCGKVIYRDQQLRENCASSLPVIPEGHCPSCGKRLFRCSCRRKKRTSFPCVSPFFYEGVVKQGIVTLKDGITAHGVPFFASAMAETVTEQYGYAFDGIAFVPATPEKERKRGYNQSRLLANALGKQLQLPVLEKALTRLYDTEDQHSSSFRQRKANVFGVFEADPFLVAGKHILLVDDIITTGATLEECGKMLLLADCEEVCGITAASTKIQKETL